MNYKLAFALGLIAPGTVGREPVAYLYNGVRLPGLPEWDKTAYPYAYIGYLDSILDSSDGYYIWVTNRPIYGKTEGIENGFIICTHGEDVSYARYWLVDGVWELKGTNIISGSDQLYAIKWSNTNVYQMLHDTTDSDIYEPTDTLLLSATDPIPVYE